MTNYLVLTGASGSGKTVLGNLLQKNYPEVFNLLEQATTRPMRSDESQMCPYIFLNQEYFDLFEDQYIGRVLSSSPYGYDYGTLTENIDENKINIILLCSEGLEHFKENIDEDDTYTVIGLDLVTDKSIREDRDLDFLKWESKVLDEANIVYKTIPATKDYVTVEEVICDLLDKTKILQNANLKVPVKEIIKKYYDGEAVEYIVESPVTVDPDVMELINTNRYKIDVLLYSLLEHSGLKINDPKAFAFRNKLYPTFVRNFDIISDEVCNANMSKLANLVLDNKITTLETDNPVLKVYLELNKHIDRETYIHSRNMIDFGNSKKECTDIYAYISNSIAEGEAVGKAQLAFIKPYVSGRKEDWERFYNGYVLMGLFNHIEDDCEDFEEDYKNGEIKLYPGNIATRTLKEATDNIKNRFANEYPEFCEIYNTWKRKRSNYNFQLS